MALIEHLERDNWKDFFCETFAYVLWTLRHDRFCHVGSAASDLRSWLTVGGIPRARHHLECSMSMRELPAERVAEVMEQVERLVSDNRSELVRPGQRWDHP